MSQKSNEANTYGTKPFTNTYGTKMLGVKIGEKATKKKPRTYGSSNKLDKLDVVHNGVPLQMIVPINIPEKKTKNVDSEKKKSKASPSDKGTFVHVHKGTL